MMRSVSILMVALLMAAIELTAQSPEDDLILSEFLCNPAGDLETEWIELHNPTAFTLNLIDYQVGDAIGLKNISDSDLYLSSGDYVILADEPDRFLSFYNDFEGLVISPMGWAILNNSGGETVRLANQYGEVIDSVYYDKGFENNRSWERYIDPDGSSYWGGSFAAEGSTPGQPNSYFYPRASSIALIIAPNPFSPDGDGFEDQTVISYEMPEADEFELVVYDIAGRKVKTFFESGAAVPGNLMWDGRGDDGRKLSVGIYILYARVEGEESIETKKTVAIAR